MTIGRPTLHFYLFCTGVVLMVAGFLLSRALLSIGMFVVIANGFLQNDFKERLSVFAANKFLLGISCLFLFPFLSGLWSSDLVTWQAAMQDKLPLLLLPFAMLMQKGLERNHIVVFAVCWMSVMLAGSLWSAAHYIGNGPAYEALYRFSKVLPTPADNDHIRFSMAIIIALLLWLQLEEWKAISSAKWVWLLRGIACWLIIYLHLLGAKTGLLGVYIIVLPLLIWKLVEAKLKPLAVAVLFGACCLPVVAYYSFPTFRARVQYVLFEQQNWESNNFAGGFSDQNRLLSIKSGWHVFKQNWLAGVGYGDIRSETAKWYATEAPAVPASEQFLPLNQWATSGSGAGVGAVILFTIVILLPFFQKEWRQNKQALFFLLFMNIIFLYETTIDDQFGVFLFTFFILIWNLTIRQYKR
jgi:hypothetical protein